MLTCSMSLMTGAVSGMLLSLISGLLASHTAAVAMYWMPRTVSSDPVSTWGKM